MSDTTPDMASHSTPQHDNVELRHTLSIHDVEAQMNAAGVERSHRQVIRYCESGLLDAVKIPGPTGEQWYIAPASVPKAIGDLKQWDAQRHAATQPDMSNHDAPKKGLNDNSDRASHSTPQHAMSEKEPSQKGSELATLPHHRNPRSGDREHYNARRPVGSTLIVPGALIVSGLHKRISETRRLRYWQTCSRNPGWARSRA